ncbi:MAG: sialidase family protein [Candidatus Bipolaricaulota bacterium]
MRWRSIVLAAILVVVRLLAVWGQTGAALSIDEAWTAPFLISSEDGSAVLLALVTDGIAVDESSVHAVWVSGCSPGNNDVYYRRSDDGGDHWGEPQRLTFIENGVAEASVEAVGENVYVTWTDPRYCEDGSVFFKYSHDRGETWSEDVLLSPSDVRSAAPEIALDGDSIYVVWEHYGEGSGHSRLRRSTDGGVHWDEPVDVTHDILSGGCPSLVPGANHKLHLAYCTREHAAETRNYNWELYYTQSLDGPEAWSNGVRLTDDVNGDSRYPVIAVSGEYIHMIWYDDRDDTKYPHYGYPPIYPEDDHNFEVYYKRSCDGGQSWGADTRLTVAEGVALETKIGVWGANVYVVWMDNRDGDYDIYEMYSADNGSTWSAGSPIINDRALSKSPSIDLDDDGTVCVIWADNHSGTMEVYFAKRPRG